MAELIFSIANTVLLIILFFYQKNKNKVLQDRIEEQNAILSASKGLIEQQSSTIDSHSKVVSSALEYAKTFDVEKVRNQLTEEISASSSQEIDELKKEHKSQLKNQEKNLKEKYNNLIANVIKKTLDQFSKMLAIPLAYFVLKMDEYDPIVRDQIFHLYEKDDKEMGEFLRKAYENGKTGLRQKK